MPRHDQLRLTQILVAKLGRYCLRMTTPTCWRSRPLGISRNTVRKYLRGEAVVEMIRRGPGRPRKLARYEAWLKKRVEASARIRLPATVLHRH